jgi:hypothetical protein
MENIYYRNEAVKKMMHAISFIIWDANNENLQDTHEMQELKKLMFRLEQRYNHYHTAYKK